ncbi:hypothetical protein QLL95_gp0200 [Cotonvirus japonicus]|uniref:Uncharacterized protein n=1 Tax=Cotonvirus japonicus TaxID=2811091 RepID=A0ABM7NRA5_9VIRU|nr:hypothetical protein QLL95_gp0200 [Cotonvirus japonicus]BCS82689.1 hypothetical protein [Cotonvirus japonicus]
MDTWNCTICGLDNCVHLNIDFNDSPIQSTTEIWPQPESHQTMKQTDLILIAGQSRNGFFVRKDVIPTGSMFEVKMTTPFVTDHNRIDLPISDGALKLIYWFFFEKQQRQIVYKQWSYWIDPISEHNVDLISDIVIEDLEVVCFKNYFIEMTENSHLYATPYNLPDKKYQTVPKINGKFYPTRAFVRVLSEYLCFPLRLEKHCSLSLKDDFKQAQKIHQRKF